MPGQPAAGTTVAAATAPRPAPRIAVLSSLFPSSEEPVAGIFIRERMARVAAQLPVTVVAPVGWFPMQGLIRRFRPHFRLTRPVDSRDGPLQVLRPRYCSIPGPILLDGAAMAAACTPVLRRITADGGNWVIDAHFAYPDGYAASLAAARLGLPYTITLRGTEQRHSRMPAIRRRMVAALGGASRVFCVSASLRRLALELGTRADRAVVVPNGVDTARYFPVERELARRRLGLPVDARVLVTVGGLVRRKGFHLVIGRLAEWRRRWGNVVYLAVGGASREGDEGAALRAQAREAGVAEHVRFLGALPPEEVRVPLSAADAMVLASSNEGWANVLLESMACGTPVVASDVGGNREVVASAVVGEVFDLQDAGGLDRAVGEALSKAWDREAIVEYARCNSWNARVEQLVAEFRGIAQAASVA
ncbi:Putative teichuronic acid biosynthesis glycosyltransferase TuaC [Gammaproteobacteria bacterium]|nr:glycosyltransferase [Gammaproteobacteria bacterium]CAG0939143.1 Putative teichuronic acid biosynthesis glycosyltransferase TuaC [Gammaproteobacteria bacterium]